MDIMHQGVRHVFNNSSDHQCMRTAAPTTSPTSTPTSTPTASPSVSPTAAPTLHPCLCDKSLVDGCELGWHGSVRKSQRP